LIGGLLVNAGHGADFLADFAARADKHGVDQAGSRKIGFADEAAQSFRAA